MTISADDLAELRALCPGATHLSEGGCGFIDLPALKIQVGQDIVVRDALLSLQAHSGYTSRLYLSAAIPSRGINWTTHTVFGRCWHTPSWNNVMPARPIEMLQQHLQAYR